MASLGVLYGAALLLGSGAVMGGAALANKLVDHNPAQVEEKPAVPVQLEPVEEVPAKAEPVQEVPAKAEPVEEVPAKAEPVEEVPAKAEPVEEVPAKAEPVEEVAAKDEDPNSPQLGGALGRPVWGNLDNQTKFIRGATGTSASTGSWLPSIIGLPGAAKQGARELSEIEEEIRTIQFKQQEAETQKTEATEKYGQARKSYATAEGHLKGINQKINLYENKLKQSGKEKRTEDEIEAKKLELQSELPNYGTTQQREYNKRLQKFMNSGEKTELDPQQEKDILEDLEKLYVEKVEKEEEKETNEKKMKELRVKRDKYDKDIEELDVKLKEALAKRNSILGTMKQYAKNKEEQYVVPKDYNARLQRYVDADREFVNEQNEFKIFLSEVWIPMKDDSERDKNYKGRYDELKSKYDAAKKELDLARIALSQPASQTATPAKNDFDTFVYNIEERIESGQVKVKNIISFDNKDLPTIPNEVLALKELIRTNPSIINMADIYYTIASSTPADIKRSIGSLIENINEFNMSKGLFSTFIKDGLQKAGEKFLNVSDEDVIMLGRIRGLYSKIQEIVPLVKNYDSIRIDGPKKQGVLATITSKKTELTGLFDKISRQYATTLSELTTQKAEAQEAEDLATTNLSQTRVRLRAISQRLGFVVNSVNDVKKKLDIVKTRIPEDLLRRIGVSIAGLPANIEALNTDTKTLLTNNLSLNFDEKSRDLTDIFISSQITKIKTAYDLIKKTKQETPPSIGIFSKQLQELDKKFTELFVLEPKWFSGLVANTMNFNIDTAQPLITSKCENVLGKDTYALLLKGKYNDKSILELLDNVADRQPFLDEILFMFGTPNTINGHTIEDIINIGCVPSNNELLTKEIQTLKPILEKLKGLSMTPFVSSKDSSISFSNIVRSFERDPVAPFEEDVRASTTNLLPAPFNAAPPVAAAPVYYYAPVNIGNQSLIEAYLTATNDNFRKIPYTDNTSFQGKTEPTRIVASKLFRLMLSEDPLFKDFKEQLLKLDEPPYSNDMISFIKKLRIKAKKDIKIAVDTTKSDILDIDPTVYTVSTRPAFTGTIYLYTDLLGYFSVVRR
jgi:hypothetical protein